MLNNLTDNFLAKMEDDQFAPLQMIVFHFASGDVFLSDRDMTVDGQLYEGIVEDWGTLVTVGAENAVASTGELSVTLWNGDTNPFSDYLLEEDPVDVFVDVYQSYDGLLSEDFAHLGEFVIQDPIEFSEASQLMGLSMVTTNMRYTAQVGRLITKDLFPNAPSSSLNKSIDLIVGNAGRVQCLCVDKPPVTTLDRSVVRSTVTIEVSDNLEDLNFAPSGLITVNDEDIVYSSRGDYVVYASQRGANGTVARDHSAGSEVIQGNHPVKYLIGQTPIGAISSIWVGGKTTSLSPTLGSEEDAAILTFSKQPTYQDISSTSTGGVYFDTTMASNTARNPSYSYDNNRKSDGSEIDSDNRSLVIANQHDLLAENGVGELVNVFLEVTSWATIAYTAQRVDVVVDGIGTVGSLTRPNAAAVFNLVADVDIDHPHEHAEGEGHDHDPVTLDYATDDPGHPHTLTNVTSDFTRESTVESVTEEVSGIGNTETFIMRLTFEPAPGQDVTKAQVAVDVSFYENGFGDATNLKLSTRDGPEVDIDDFENSETRTFTISAGTWDTSYTTRTTYVRLTGNLHSGSVANGLSRIRIGGALLTCTVTNESADPAIANVVTTKTGDGTVAQSTLDASGNEIQKKVDDVDELLIDNRTVNVDEESGTYSQSFTDNFDLLDHYPNMDWDFLHNRQVSLNFVGTSGVTVFVTWMQFVVEYRPAVLKTTDEVSCVVVGSIESRPDAVIEYLLTEKAGLSVDKLSSVYRESEGLDDDGIPDDGDVWGYGETAEPVPGAAFEEASGWFDHNSYTLDGVISGSLSVRDAIEKITFQTRCKLLWQGGFAKLAVKRKVDDWLIAKDIPVDDVQVKSYELKRSEVSEIVNSIDLFYSINRLDDSDGAGQYEGTASVSDLQSITKHGEKTDIDRWLFDLVRNESMATDLAEYYLWELGESSTYYTFNTYLKHFDLEKEDYATINAYKFARLNQLPIVIKEIQREFGSGKLNKMDVLKLVCQSIRHYIHTVVEEDIITVSDALNIELGRTLSLEEVVSVSGLMEFEWGKAFDDSVSVSDMVDIVFVIGEKITEAITVSTEFSVHIDMDIEETILVLDDMYTYAGAGYGVGAYGTSAYGSRQAFEDHQVEALTTKDEASFGMGVGLEDEQVVEDSISFSGGYGGNGLGSGYGLAPYGK